MKTIYRILLLTLTALSAEAEPPKVNFQMWMLDKSTNPNKFLSCDYKDVLKFSKDKDGANRAQLELSEETALKPETHDACSKVFTNLTRLSEEIVRDEIAAIISEMPCEPGSTLMIESSAKTTPRVSKDYPDAPHDHVIYKMAIKNCLSHTPPKCTYPTIMSGPDPNGNILDYKTMKKFFEECRDAIKNPVKYESLLDKLDAENKAKEPTKKNGSTTAPVTPPDQAQP